MLREGTSTAPARGTHDCAALNRLPDRGLVEAEDPGGLADRDLATLEWPNRRLLLVSDLEFWPRLAASLAGGGHALQRTLLDDVAL